MASTARIALDDAASADCRVRTACISVARTELEAICESWASTFGSAWPATLRRCLTSGAAGSAVEISVEVA